MPFAIPEIASDHKRANLPLLWTVVMSFLIKWIIGMIGGIAIVNSTDYQTLLVEQAALVAIAAYTLLLVVP